MASINISNPAPRVNGSEQMGQFVGKRVTLVGQVESCEAGTLKLKGADGASIQAAYNGPAPTSLFMEVVGVVQSSTAMTADGWAFFGDQFDMGNYSELCKLSNTTYRQMFLA